jgi:acyl-coenzyme A synthetase/AMP-(fatty) acid ligase
LNDRLLPFFQTLGERPCLITSTSSYSYRDLYHAMIARDLEVELSTELSWPALLRLLKAAINNLPFSFDNSASSSGLWLQTTGTTGAPKLVQHTWKNWLAQYRLKDGGVRSLLLVMAFNHIGGLHSVFSALSRGMTIVLPVSKDSASVKAALHAHKVFMLPTTPSHLGLLLQSGCFNEPLSYLRLISYGAEALSPVLKQRISELQPHIRWRETYGSTETGILSLQSGNEPGNWQPGFRYKVIDAELYVENLGATWVPTGDLVEEIGPNRLRFLGRKGTRVKVGGILVSPVQTAAWLRKQPDVLQVSVDAVANPLLGQVLEARIWAAPETDFSQLEKQLRMSFPSDFAKEAMPVRYKFEKYFGINNHLKVR